MGTCCAKLRRVLSRDKQENLNLYIAEQKDPQKIEIQSQVNVHHFSKPASSVKAVRQKDPGEFEVFSTNRNKSFVREDKQLVDDPLQPINQDKKEDNIEEYESFRSYSSKQMREEVFS